MKEPEDSDQSVDEPATWSTLAEHTSTEENLNTVEGGTFSLEHIVEERSEVEMGMVDAVQRNSEETSGSIAAATQADDSVSIYLFETISS